MIVASHITYDVSIGELTKILANVINVPIYKVTIEFMMDGPSRVAYVRAKVDNTKSPAADARD